METKSAIVAGVHAVYTWRSGRGIPIICLHGWADSAQGFTPLLQALQTKRPIYCLNLPGFGGSQAPPHPWGVTDYAHFVSEFMQKMQLNSAVLMGHSNGGAIAVKVAAEQPALVDRLILIASAGIRSTADQRLHRQAFKWLAKTGRVVSRPLGQHMQSRLKRQLYKKAGSDYLLVPHMHETFKKVVGEDVRQAAQSCVCPALLIWGDQDTATPLFMAQAYAELMPQSHLEIIEGATHFVHQEAAPQVARVVEGFLES